jgi:glucose-6-phosphate 1-dehydrogenase
MERVSLKLIQEKPTKDGSEKEELALEQGLSCSAGFCLGDYASLIFDIINGKKIFFLSYPEIIAAWKVIDDVIKLKATGGVKIHQYEDGSTGPADYLNLPQKEGFNWN